MTIDKDDPRSLLISFLEGLPQTIRTEAFLFIIVYAIGTDVPDNREDFESVVRDYLSKSGIRGIGAVICAIAVIDHHFFDVAAKFEAAESMLKELSCSKPDFPQDSLLSIPLRRRHADLALEDWQKLRATKLTARKLQDFEYSQLMPPLDT
ncbi:hypothetical protein [Sideroxydans lithotrophicus]|uniref:Uncharacterized protein n=1 Tax=Sideroxydans lithotrophicus (strain ES-1) TaxID=580332 RepID=D5CT86_SIDLE|nr:hypothetical protein [Sideroxydans lithotrophicus]ADE12172.1 conserved hypothetical protein [Sideroxydans lithotrophicus ES-1]